MIPSLLLLITASSIPHQIRAVVCWQCGGEEYSSGLRVLHSSCCRPSRRVCGHGLACLRATVNSPGMQFILSGCHPPEDGFIGCDSHKLPYNATIQRCACLDEGCQKYFPGNCEPTAGPPPISAPVPANVFTNLINNNQESNEKSIEKSNEESYDDEAFRLIRERGEPIKTSNNGDPVPQMAPRTASDLKNPRNLAFSPSLSRIFLLFPLIFLRFL